MAAPGWWTGLEGVAKNVLLTAWSEEAFLDDIITTKKAIAQDVDQHVTLDFFIQRGCQHNEAYVDFACGDEQIGATNLRMLDWIREVYV